MHCGRYGMINSKQCGDNGGKFNGGNKSKDSRTIFFK